MLTIANTSFKQMSPNDPHIYTASPFNGQCDFNPINNHFTERSLPDLLRWCLSTFGDTAVQVTSFGPTGIVLLDHLARLWPGIRVITLDTGYLFPETYRLLDDIQRRFSINLDVRHPESRLEDNQPAVPLWQVNPDQCCYRRKVLPLQAALTGVNAWFTGLRRDQSVTRANLHLVAWDSTYDLVKINPLANWSRAQVWKYLLEHNLPYNPLHDQGYTSIGCTHCTRPATNPLDERSGRWQDQAKTECGLHLPQQFSN